MKQTIRTRIAAGLSLVIALCCLSACGESRPTLDSSGTSSPPESAESLAASSPEESAPAVSSVPEARVDSSPSEAEASAVEPPPAVSSAIHEHQYQNATCTQGGVCACGAVGPALGHQFSEATCTAASVCTRCGLEKSPALGHSYSKGACVRCGEPGGFLTKEEAQWFKNKLTDEQNAQALAVARSIAESIPAGSDLERVTAAAEKVAEYSQNCEYSMEGIYYSQAYGVFIAGVYSCAGSTRALGLVLSCMGYRWTHVNENQYTHQWISLTLDGQEGFADGQIGMAGYGKYPYA